MTSRITPYGAVSIADERARVGEMSDTRKREIGELWLLWLAHVAKCQVAVTDPHPRSYRALDNTYPERPWDCCTVHQVLRTERDELVKRAEALGIPMAPHQPDQVLIRAWWAILGYNYHAGMQIVD